MSDTSEHSGTRQAEVIRAEMRRVRRELPEDMDRLVDGARRLVDWKHYVEMYPWAATAAAAVLGYMLVPRRPQVIQPDAATLEKLVKQQRVTLQPKSAAKTKTGLVDTLVGIIGAMAVRAGAAYATEQLGSVLGQSAAKEERKRDQRERQRS